MAFEMLMLGLTTLLVAVAWLPASVANYHANGLNWLTSNRSLSDLSAMPEWGRRCLRAQEDLKEDYPAFAVAVLLLAFTGGFTAGTAVASALFLGVRLVQISACIGSIPWLRILARAAGFLATLYLLFMALVALISF